MLFARGSGKTRMGSYCLTDTKFQFEKMSMFWRTVAMVTQQYGGTSRHRYVHLTMIQLVKFTLDVFCDTHIKKKKNSVFQWDS